MKHLQLLILTVVVLAARAHGAERARLENIKTEWQNAYGAIIYTVLADVKNLADTPVQYVKVKVELVDKNGKVVAERFGYNAGAEVLEVVIEGDDAQTPEQRLQQVKSIAVGRSDLVRISFDKTDIGHPFRTTNVTLAEVH
jgi:hypothetical protein